MLSDLTVLVVLVGFEELVRDQPEDWTVDCLSYQRSCGGLRCKPELVRVFRGV